MKKNVYDKANLNDKLEFNFHIAKETLDEKHIKYLNAICDKFLKENISKKYDATDKLVGVIVGGEQVFLPSHLFDPMKKELFNHIKEYVKKLSHGKYLVDNIYDEVYWMVSSRVGDFNPLHNHTGTLSGVMYLKMPPKDEYENGGGIGFWYDRFSPQNLCFGGATIFRPEVGDLVLFPSWLPHTVYPFHTEAERRSIAFNIKLEIVEA